MALGGDGRERTGFGPRPPRPALVLGLSALALACPLPDAAGAAATVTWSAPAGCPTREAFAAMLDRTLGEPLDHFESRSRFLVRVERVGTGYRLVIDDATGTAESRALTDESCDALAGAAAAVIALSLRGDPGAAPERPGASPERARRAAPAEPAGAPNTGPDPTLAPPSSDSTGVGSREPGHAVLSGRLLADAGSLPQLAPGVRLGLGHRRHAFAALGHLGFVGPSATTDLPGGRFWLSFLALDLCGFPVDRRVAWGLCAESEVGWLTGRGMGVEAPRTRSSPWAALGGGLAASLGLGASPWHAELGVGLLGVIHGPPFVLDGPAVHRPDPAVFRAEAGVSRRFW